MVLYMKTHGHSNPRTPTYRSWECMRQRCYNSNHTAYARYGGRGISVCERWDDFSVFLADMGERPSRDYSIDRINGDGNYEPNNCRWATRSEQVANRGAMTRTLPLVEYNGKNQSVERWEEETGLDARTIASRIWGARWPIEDALTMAPHSRPITK